MVEQWEDEYAQMTGDQNVTEEDFWEKLQKHWEDVDKYVLKKYVSLLLVITEKSYIGEKKYMV